MPGVDSWWPAWRSLTAVALAPTAPAAAGNGDGNPEVPDPMVPDITMIQANIYTGLSVERFQADVRKVLAVQPDFVTYNEVPFRNDEVMAPEGYAIYRDMTDRFTAATPVAWREDRWTAIDQGIVPDLELARQAAGPGGRARPALRQLGDPAGRRRPGASPWCRSTWRRWSAACPTCSGAR